MLQSEVKIRVRYAETDQMGYVYYGNFAAYYEVARTEVFRELGIHYKEMEEGGVGMPVLDFRVRYYRPARYDDLLTIRLLLKNKPEGSRIKFEFETYNEGGDLLNVGETTMVFVQMKNGKPTAIPSEIQTKIGSFFS
jgi:acyl-CoA thioester hydrolase